MISIFSVQLAIRLQNINKTKTATPRNVISKICLQTPSKPKIQYQTDSICHYLCG